ncbi:MAG TPA: carbon-nitrogen hydrolase family protein [candidate division Zixibacteria bacterium]|nr:carbon-nitrogen hydrolase family protein [candidate division Zixibacteria bacterium]
MTSINVAACQIDPQLGEVETNLDLIRGAVEDAAAAGATFTVLPEAAVTGYAFASLSEAMPVARRAERVAANVLAGLAETHRMTIICGSLDPDGDELFNVALVSLPDGRRYRYRKMHLPFLGVDRFATPGPDAPPVIETDGLRFGVLICYDLRFPEAARICALEGADLIALPTNWPVGVEFHPELFAPARANENHCYLLAADRVGTERGVKFMGRSLLLDYDGNVLAEAGDGPELLVGEIDPQAARQTHVRRRPGEHEWDTIGDRRPGLYDRLLRPGVDRQHPPTAAHYSVDAE